MTKISIYNKDTDVRGNDKWIGSDAQNQNRTKNFTPDNVATYFNENQVIDLGVELRYFYDTLDPLQERVYGSITFETEIGPQVNFSTISTFLLSKYTMGHTDVSQFLDFLIGSNVILSRSNNINMFGYYKIGNIEPYLPDPNFFVVTLTFESGNGYMKEDEDYFISLVQFEQTIPDVPTRTSDLINDGQDGVHPFITAEDAPTPNLQEVTDQDSTTTNTITVNSTQYQSAIANNNIYTTDKTTGSGVGLDPLGLVNFDNGTGGSGIISSQTLTHSNVVLDFPDKISGNYTIATTTDIPSITPAALTKINDTNVTLTLGGSPSTSLLQSVSLTLGWTGTLADSRITSASTWNAKQNAITLTTTGTSGAATFVGSTLNIPNYSTDLTGYVPYTGANQNVNLGEYELKAGQLTLDTTPTGTATVGTTRWNDTIGSSETTLKGGTVVLKNGVDLVARVVNKVTPNATLLRANYTAVRVSGAQGQRLAVAYAQANSDANSADTIGVVCENIATNQEGFIMTVGQLIDVNTTGSLQGETWADGDVLYLSPTAAGKLTNIKPTGLTGHIVVVGYVEYSHAIHGSIYIKVMNGWELDELHNVYINPATLANNDGLFYDSADQLWKNETIASALGFTPVTNARTISTTAPLSGGGDLSANRTLSITQATTSTNGYLSSTDWNTFNNKQAALGYTAQNADLFTRLRNGWEASTDYISALFNDGWNGRQVGTGAVTNSAGFILNSNKVGIAISSTGTTSTGYAGMEFSSPNTGAGFGIGNGELVFEHLIMIPTLSTSTERFHIFSGIIININFANPQNAIFFHYDEGGSLSPASPFWKCYTSNAGTRTQTTTSISVTANQWYKLKCIINATGTSVSFYIDGNLVATHTTNINNSISYALNNSIIKTVGTTARTLYTDYSAISQTLTTTR